MIVVFAVRRSAGTGEVAGEIGDGDDRRGVERRVEATALLSPFDPVGGHRSRAARLFGFDYRLEIYTPLHKRVHGYYVLPYLLNEALVARVDLKADRAAGLLRVPAITYEPGVDVRLVRARLQSELEAMAAWLQLGRGVAEPVGRPENGV